MNFDALLSKGLETCFVQNKWLAFVLRIFKNGILDKTKVIRLISVNLPFYLIRLRGIYYGKETFRESPVFL